MSRVQNTTRPTQAQIAATRAVVGWYVRNYFRQPHDPGVTARFCDPAVVGAWAVDAMDLRAGEPSALFRLLLATAMFQRRQDQQILRILRATPPAAADELTDPLALLQMARSCGCSALVTNDSLLKKCDLTKDPETKRGRCTYAPTTPCRLKEHTVWLRRYGHFGKVPTSAALVLQEHGAGDLRGVYESVIREHRSRIARAAALESTLSRIWRVNQKIACMFLSAVSNPDLAGDLAPWSGGLDWRRFVVVDSNVDLFLNSIGYAGSATYDARRSFVQELALQIDLRAEGARSHGNNPRLVQQAMFVFMSIANRRATQVDCMHRPASCSLCPRAVRKHCAVQSPRVNQIQHSPL